MQNMYKHTYIHTYCTPHKFTHLFTVKLWFVGVNKWGKKTYFIALTYSQDKFPIRDNKVNSTLHTIVLIHSFHPHSTQLATQHIVLYNLPLSYYAI